jgi:endonuclease YncB( thermonuclease family)
MKKLIFTALLFTQITNAETVSKIIDGDTIKVLEQSNSIRLYCIDTPESVMVGNQKAQIVNGLNYGELATKHLKTLINVGDAVELECTNKKSYDRSVCVIYKQGVNINLKMVEEGYATVLQEYCPKRKGAAYYKALENAKNAKVGLWAKGGIIDPQAFRNCVRSRSKQDCNK